MADEASKKEQQRSTIGKQQSSAQTESGIAMGKVRRIEECVILGQKWKIPHKRWGFR